jgi:polysaccharide export outer membrane protein
MFVSSAAAQMREIPGASATPPTQPTAPLGGLPEPQAAWSTSVTGVSALLGPGDQIEITVFDVPELSQRVRVNGSGKITLALIGEVDVNGMTTESLRSWIADELVKRSLVRKPEVSVFVTSFAGQLVSILGEVNRPGAYPLLRSHRLQDLIAVAGGPSARAGNLVTITRADGKEQIQVSLDGKDETVNNPEIFPGDRISISQTGIVYVLGEVGRPGGFLIDRHNTVTVLQALALAEGIQSSASIKKATLFRKDGTGSQQIAVNVSKILKSESPDIPVREGDILYIYGSLTRGMGRTALTTLMNAASTAAVYAAIVQ